MASTNEELTIFVERLLHFFNLWAIYNDLLTKAHAPSTIGDEVARSAYESFFEPTTTMMLVVYAYFYSLVEESKNGVNAFRLWREQFPEEEAAILTIEAQVKPFIKDLRVYRNRLGFHGSRSRMHEAPGFDLFANTTGSAAWNALMNFKAFAATLLGKAMAVKQSDAAEIARYRLWIDSIAERARQQLRS